MIHPVVCNPVLGPLVGVKDPVRWLAGRGYLSGAILHWDANLDPYTEQTGGPHTFNHAVLSPQYQRNADGSYSNVGAKPAADVFDGEKWLRSCGAVTNLLWAGSENFTGWDYRSNLTDTESMIGSIPSRRITIKANGPVAFLARGLKPANFAPFFSILVKKGNTDWIYFGFNRYGDHGSYFNLATGTVGESLGTAQASIEPLGNGIFRLNVWSTTVYDEFHVTPPRPCGGNNVLTVTAGQYVDVAQFQLTATPYPVPYVPPGVTQPASNATTTNGMWFSLPDGSPLWQALTGSPLTLATRVRMGVGSGDKPDDVILGAGGPAPMYTKTSGDERTMLLSYDGTASRFVYVLFPRNTIITRVTQVNTAGTQYRVGYMIEGTHTTIQWSSWGNYDGSFSPSTLYRLMLGLNTPYPIWFNKITVWKEQATDAEILEAWT